MNILLKYIKQKKIKSVDNLDEIELKELAKTFGIKSKDIVYSLSYDFLFKFINFIFYSIETAQRKFETHSEFFIIK